MIDGDVILCCDRRLVVRECDCFCLGTAMGGEQRSERRCAARALAGAEGVWWLCVARATAWACTGEGFAPGDASVQLFSLSLNN